MPHAWPWLAPVLVCAPLEFASASLILDDALPFGNLGLDRPPVVLTIQGPDSSMVSGCVGWDGFTDIIGPNACPGTGSTGGGEMTGATQTVTVSLYDASVSSAADLRILFQLQEPRGSTLALDNLVLRVFSPDGSILFTSGPFVNSLVVTELYPYRKLGFLFRLSVEDLGSVPSEIFTNPNNRIGLATTVSGSSGGPERFSVFSWDEPPEPVPEPTSFLLAAAGLLAVLAVRRR